MRRLMFLSILILPLLVGCGSLLSVTQTESRYIPEKPVKSQEHKEAESKAADHIHKFLSMSYKYGLPPQSEAVKMETKLADSLVSSLGKPSSPIPLDLPGKPLRLRLSSLSEELSKPSSGLFDSSRMEDYVESSTPTFTVDNSEDKDKTVATIPEPYVNPEIEDLAESLNANISNYKEDLITFENQLSSIRQAESTKQAGVEVESGWLKWFTGSIPLIIIGIIAFVILVPGSSGIIIWLFKRSARQIGEIVQGIEKWKSEATPEEKEKLKRHLRSTMSSDTKGAIERRKNGS